MHVYEVSSMGAVVQIFVILECVECISKVHAFDKVHGWPLPIIGSILL